MSAESERSKHRRRRFIPNPQQYQEYQERRAAAVYELTFERQPLAVVAKNHNFSERKLRGFLRAADMRERGLKFKQANIAANEHVQPLIAKCADAFEAGLERNEDAARGSLGLKGLIAMRANGFHTLTDAAQQPGAQFHIHGNAQFDLSGLTNEQLATRANQLAQRLLARTAGEGGTTGATPGGETPKPEPDRVHLPGHGEAEAGTLPKAHRVLPRKRRP